MKDEHSKGNLIKLNRELSWKVATNLMVSFQYAWAGLTYAYKTQRNFRIHVFAGSAVLGLGMLLGLDWTKMAILVLTVGGVMTMEMLNTAIESVVDLTIKQTYHDLAKIAKDCAAGAVLLSSLAAILVGCLLLAPPLVMLFLRLWQAYVSGPTP